MPDKKVLLVNLSDDTHSKWGDLCRLLDDFRSDQGVYIEIASRDFLSYERLSDLVGEVVQRGMIPVAKVVVTAVNYKDLPKIVSALKNKGMASVTFSQIFLSALSSEHYSALVPTKDMLPHLMKAVKTARKEGVPYYFENLPLCLLPGEEDHFVAPHAPGFKMQFCLDCALSPRCGGITKAQVVAEYGTKLLSWQFLFPKNFFSDEDIAFLDEQLLKSARKD